MNGARSAHFTSEKSLVEVVAGVADTHMTLSLFILRLRFRLVVRLVVRCGEHLRGARIYF